MKHLRLFESFKEEDIHKICKEFGIYNYTINEDGSIDVDGNVDFLSSSRLKKLPLKFNNVTGYFSCSYNRLTSLEGAPKSVGSYFDCSNNQLTSLEGCPESVGSYFYCPNNKLTSLEGAPKSVGSYFDCSYNQLTSLEGCPKYVSRSFYCDNNKITTFEHLPFSMGGEFYCADNPIYQIWKLFADYSKIEFLNDCDAIREPNIIVLDRLNFFLEEIGEPTVTEVKGYKCI